MQGQRIWPAVGILRRSNLMSSSLYHTDWPSRRVDLHNSSSIIISLQLDTMSSRIHNINLGRSLGVLQAARVRASARVAIHRPLRQLHSETPVLPPPAPRGKKERTNHQEGRESTVKGWVILAAIFLWVGSVFIVHRESHNRVAANLEKAKTQLKAQIARARSMGDPQALRKATFNAARIFTDLYSALRAVETGPLNKWHIDALPPQGLVANGTFEIQHDTQVTVLEYNHVHFDPYAPPQNTDLLLVMANVDVGENDSG